jgi:hypothetical protein
LAQSGAIITDPASVDDGDDLGPDDYSATERYLNSLAP